MTMSNEPSDELTGFRAFLLAVGILAFCGAGIAYATQALKTDDTVKNYAPAVVMAIIGGYVVLLVTILMAGRRR